MAPTECCVSVSFSDRLGTWWSYTSVNVPTTGLLESTVSDRSASRMRSRNASERFLYPRLAIKRSNSFKRSSSSETPVLANSDMCAPILIVALFLPLGLGSQIVVFGLADGKQSQQRQQRGGGEIVPDVLQSIRFGQPGGNVRRQRGAQNAGKTEGQRAAGVTHGGWEELGNYCSQRPVGEAHQGEAQCHHQR